MITRPIDRRSLLTLAGGVTIAGLAGASPAAAAPPRAQRRLPRLVQLWAQAWNTGDADLMASLFTADGSYTDHAFQATFHGPAGIHQSILYTLTSVPDAHVVVDDAMQNGDRMVAHWTFAGTFSTVEPFTQGDPRGRTFSVPALSYFTLANGMIDTAEDFYNLADMMRQLGLPVPYTPFPG